MKKVFAILMCLVMVVAFMPAMAWAETPQQGVIYQLSWDEDDNPVSGETVQGKELSVNNTLTWCQDYRVGDSNGEHSSLTTLKVTATWGTDTSNKLEFVCDEEANKDNRNYVQNNLIGIYGDLEGYFSIENMMGMIGESDNSFTIKAEWESNKTTYEATTTLKVVNGAEPILSEVVLSGDTSYYAMNSENDYNLIKGVYEIPYDKNINYTGVVKNYVIVFPGTGVLNYSPKDTDNQELFTGTTIRYQEEGQGAGEGADYTLLSVDFSNITAEDLNKEYTLIFSQGDTKKEVKIKFVSPLDSSLTGDTLYCVNRENCVCDDNGILKVNYIDALYETLNLKVNWEQDLYFAKLNNEGYLQAVAVETNTTDSPIELYIEQAKDYETDPNGQKIPHYYNVYANKEGQGTIKEANGVLTINVKSDLPDFGMYYSKDISINSFMFFNQGFSYLLLGDTLEGDKIFYAALNKDAEQNIEDLEFKITDCDNNPITNGITVGEMDNSNAQYYIWPISVSEQFRSAEDNRVYISLYRGEDEMYWDYHHIYDSQTIPEDNQLVWVDMSDGKYIDKGYISTPNGNDFDNNFMLTGKVGETISNICFGYREEQGDGRVFVKVIDPEAGSYDIFSVSEVKGKPSFYDVTLKKEGKTVYEIKDTDNDTSYLMFANVTKPAAGGGGAPAAPTKKPATDPTQSGNTTTTDMSGSTVSKDGQTTTTVDKQVADKLVETAVANKSEEIVISTVTKNQPAASSIKASEVALPAETLQTIANKTNANIVIKTDVAEVKLDNEAAEAIAQQAQTVAGTEGKTETVSIITQKVKEEADEVSFELKVVTSSGKVISDFNGGNVSVTVNVPKSLSDKKLVCVYIDENGLKHRVDGQSNTDGTYTFTTGHFSTYAIMSEEDAEKAIQEQKETIKAIKFKLSSQIVKTKSGKKAVKLTWSNPSDIEFEGVAIYRSTKKNTGYGKKPIYVSKSDKYINTAVKSGKKYYYKVRGFVTIDGEKVYTDWSYKAYRTVK